MIVFGIGSFGKVKARSSAMQRLVRERLGVRGRLTMAGDYLQATVRALEEGERGEVAAVAGCLDDVALPSDHIGFGRTEWQESWLRFLEERHIAFLALPREQEQPEAGAAASIIRSYNRAATTLADLVRKLQSEQRRDQKHAQGGYVCGRPPYGYSVEDGAFVINDAQAKAVKFIFREMRGGKSLTQIISKLRIDHAYGGVIKRKRQYWDRVKVHRILKHRNLYCLGRYDVGERGEAVELPNLAFLPPEWVDTMPTKANPQAASAAT